MYWNGVFARLSRGSATTYPPPALMSKGHRGHFCWVCERLRANERFSGRGHARHVCKDCSRLPREELAYRQTLRNISRIVGFSNLIPRKTRPRLERFATHHDERIRQHVRALFERHDREVAALRADEEPSDPVDDEWLEGLEAIPPDDPDADIPF